MQSKYDNIDYVHQNAESADAGKVFEVFIKDQDNVKMDEEY